MAGPVRNVETGTVTALAMTRQNAPRPPNAWILYRSDRLKELPPLAQGERRAQADVSRMISRMWKNETDETRQHYERLADEKKAEHSIKYPGYRFQPMKKEERVALREQKKMVKEAERKSRQQQRGRASQQPPTLPPTSHSTPEPQALQVPPLSIQHAHLYPPIPSGSIYYPIELFGPAGPSPPVSLASSPAPESSPESTTTSDESYETTSSHPPSVVATPAVGLATLLPLDPHVSQTLPSSIVPSPAIPSGGNPYLALFGPAATRTTYSTSPQSAVPMAIPNFANPVVPTPIPTPSPNPSLISSALHLQSNAYAAHTPLGPIDPQLAVDHDGQSTSGITTLAQTGSTPQPVTPDNGQITATAMSSLTAAADAPSDPYAFDDQAFASFNFPMNSEFIESMRALTESDSYGRQVVDAWNLGTDIFTMPDLDPSQLVALPQGSLEVNIGDFNDFDLGAYGNPGMLDLSLNTSTFVDQHDTSNGELAPDILELLQGNFLATENDPPTAAAAEPAPPIPPSNTQVALSVDLSNTENCQKSSTPYVPPSGAAFASSRRVGGRWKPPPSLANEGSFDHPSPCSPTVGGPFL